MGCDDCGSNSQKYSLSGDQEVSKSTNKTQASTLQFLVLLPPCTKSIQKYEKTWKNSPCVLAILHKGYNSGIQLSGGYSPGSLANNTFIDIYRWFSRVFLFRKWGVIVKMGSDCPLVHFLHRENVPNKKSPHRWSRITQFWGLPRRSASASSF